MINAVGEEGSIAVVLSLWVSMVGGQKTLSQGLPKTTLHIRYLRFMIVKLVMGSNEKDCMAGVTTT